MAFLRAHLAATAVVVAAVAVLGGVFASARPAYHPEATPLPPDHGLPYTEVTYSVADARRLFPRAVVRSRSSTATDLSTPDGSLELTVFGDRAAVEAAGFYDYTNDERGNYVHFARRCTPGAKVAERWIGNVRVLRRCD